MVSTLNWGIIGAGSIAGAFASHLPKSRTGKLLAIGSRLQAKAEQFGDQYGVPRRYGSYEALLADPEVQAVYIATPHPEHLAVLLKAAAAKKHILCEKPLGLNYEDALVMVDAARKHDVFLMEAFMYRCHPQTHKLIDLIRQKTIGDVKFIQATFSFAAPFDPQSRLWNNSLGGGGILDVGCYPVSFSRLIAGVQSGKPFLDPVTVTGAGYLHPQTGIDAYAAATLQFENGVIAQVATGVGVEQDNVARIYGTEGWIYLPTPWVPARDGGVAKIIVHKHGETTPLEIALDVTEPIYAIEADTVAEHIDARQAVSPAMSWADTLGNLQTLDRWRAAIGLVYETER